MSLWLLSMLTYIFIYKTLHLVSCCLHHTTLKNIQASVYILRIPFKNKKFMVDPVKRFKNLSHFKGMKTDLEFFRFSFHALLYSFP